MLFYNGLIFTPSGYMRGGFRVENGLFAELLPGLVQGKGIDLKGAKVLPGLIDIHVHGAMGADFSDGDPAGLRRMAEYLALHGVTGFAPTSMTLPCEALAASFQTADEFRQVSPQNCARLLGIHMEGPFLSGKKKGSQNEDYLREPDFGELANLQRASGNLIRIVDVAPELPGALEFIRQAAKLCRVSVAHTEADYETASAAYDEGATHLTHLFNAMPPIHHRAPGVIGSASEREQVTAELICDGIHVHPGMVRMAFRLFPERICLISDALRCCGMPDGTYELGGQPCLKKDGAAWLSDGTLAGSSTNLFECMRNAVCFGIPEPEAIRAATITPARVIGASDQVGSVEPGKYADFLICGDNLTLNAVYQMGGRTPI